MLVPTPLQARFLIIPAMSEAALVAARSVVTKKVAAVGAAGVPALTVELRSAASSAAHSQAETLEKTQPLPNG